MMEAELKAIRVKRGERISLPYVPVMKAQFVSADTVIAVRDEWGNWQPPEEYRMRFCIVAEDEALPLVDGIRKQTHICSGHPEGIEIHFIP